MYNGTSKEDKNKNPLISSGFQNLKAEREASLTPKKEFWLYSPILYSLEYH